MGVYVNDGPVNPAQVIAHLGATGCTVRADEDAGTWEVEVAGKSTAQIGAACAAIVYDEGVSSVTEASP